MNDLRLQLTKLAERKCWCDDPSFDPNEYSGGNYDDAYSGGSDDGEALLARYVLEVMEREQWKPR